MSGNAIYEAIAKRTGGDVYVGVVGPVRSGKSTFIHSFMDSVVIPNIENEYDKERALDEIPQSGSGKTITTTEPKFVPTEAVRLTVGGAQINVRMIDCVGYMVDGALGASEDGKWRMVITPWSNDPMPFVKAAEIGTERVAREHSTVAMLVTTDGSIADIPRENYVAAEERAVRELAESGKPFAIILNSANPDNDEAHELASHLESKYSAPVALVNCTKLNAEDVEAILGLVVGEFPIRELCFHLPDWTSLLPDEHPINKKLIDTVESFSSGVKKLSDIDRMMESISCVSRISVDAGTGKGELEIPLSGTDYYSALSELSGMDIANDKDLFSAFIETARIKRDYDRIGEALESARTVGYGIVMPTPDELSISMPEPVRQGGSYGVRISAEAESIHMIKTRIRADVCPTFGSQEQSEEVIKALSADYEQDPNSLLESKMFGRTLYELVGDSMNAKLLHMPEESRLKMGQTIEKIINEGASGLICILV